MRSQGRDRYSNDDPVVGGTDKLGQGPCRALKHPFGGTAEDVMNLNQPWDPAPRVEMDIRMLLVRGSRKISASAKIVVQPIYTREG